MNSENEVYYKLFHSKNGYLTIVCLQWFDEFDYDKSRFYKEDGDDLIFSKEQFAIEYLNLNFEREDIDPEYYRVKKKI
jgi:hypothetical protein